MEKLTFVKSDSNHYGLIGFLDDNQERTIVKIYEEVFYMADNNRDLPFPIGAELIAMVHGIQKEYKEEQSTKKWTGVNLVFMGKTINQNSVHHGCKVYNYNETGEGMITHSYTCANDGYFLHHILTQTKKYLPLEATTGTILKELSKLGTAEQLAEFTAKVEVPFIKSYGSLYNMGLRYDELILNNDFHTQIAVRRYLEDDKETLKKLAVIRVTYKGKDEGSCVSGMSVKDENGGIVIGQICQGSITNERYFEECISVLNEAFQNKTFSIEYGRMD